MARIPPSIHLLCENPADSCLMKSTMTEDALLMARCFMYCRGDPIYLQLFRFMTTVNHKDSWCTVLWGTFYFKYTTFIQIWPWRLPFFMYGLWTFVVFGQYRKERERELQPVSKLNEKVKSAPTAIKTSLRSEIFPGWKRGERADAEDTIRIWNRLSD